jgi:hypothetical protein
LRTTSIKNTFFLLDFYIYCYVGIYLLDAI